MEWARVKVPRDQCLLFPQKLDDAISETHDVRVLDKILRQLDWSQWEAKYERSTGRPPFHPRILVGVILYGMLCRITSSRRLEEALEVRLDFRWLAEGHSIDHSTICKFRTDAHEEIRKVFVQLALLGRELGWVRFTKLGYDGTRLRSNNSRQASRTPQRLRELQKELTETYEKHAQQAQASDQRDAEQFGDASGHELDVNLADVKRELDKVNAALAEIDKLEDAGKTIPKRIPTTDPESRIMPNKDGGHSPNYTPTAMVDIESGMIVGQNVLNVNNEDGHLLSELEQVKEDFGLTSMPEQLLADGLMATGENISGCNEAGIELYAPIKTTDPTTNPAVREKLDQPVDASEFNRLPVTNVTVDGQRQKQLSKDAFVYDSEKDCYWCPNGKVLESSGSTSEKRSSGSRRTRYRYKIEGSACVDCPLLSLCQRKPGSGRQVTHEEHEQARIAHAKKMATDEAKETYTKRQHPAERPFATIKACFEVRQFKSRGLSRVQCEWSWLTAAFNLHRLISWIQNHADPPPPELKAISPSR